MDSKSDVGAKAAVLPIAIGVSLSFGICFLLLSIFAAILSKGDFGESTLTAMSFTAQTLGALIGGFAAAKINKKNGLIMGVANGAIMFALLTVLSMILGGSLSVMTVIRLILLVLGSTLGGIMGVNIRKKQKLL